MYYDGSCYYTNDKNEIYRIGSTIFANYINQLEEGLIQ